MANGRPLCWGRLLWRLLPALLWRWRGAGASSSSGPVGTITALATQSRQYSSTVSVAYVEPVNCTLQFDEDVVNLGVNSFQRDPDTRILNLEQVQLSTYRFQVASLSNANVTISIPPQTVRNAAGHTNNDTTAVFSFHFYAYPPAATIRLDGYPGHSSAALSNVAYLVLNSTTEFDGVQHLDASMVSISPALDVQGFERVSWDTFRFGFQILQNSTPEVTDITCVDGNDIDDQDNETQPERLTTFRCRDCSLPLVCAMDTQYPPSIVPNLEFPFEVVIQPIPALGLGLTSLPVMYDTLWAHVSLDAPQFARGPFNLTITWSEPMRDLLAVLPTLSGVLVQARPEDAVVVSPSSVRLWVIPSQTGMLTISINGTQDSSDMAGNTNDFRRNPHTRTGDSRVVVFSAGPPAAGTVACAYSWPATASEYRASGSSSSSPSVPSLTVSWSGFLTATRYSIWLTWSTNLSTTVASQPGPLLGQASCGENLQLCPDSYTFSDFPVSLGLEYTVYVRAFNIWGDEVTVNKLFLHPQLNVIADGRYQVIRLPTLLSQEQTLVDFDVIVPQRGFLSVNPLKVLSFSSANRSAGDRDPCSSETSLLRCTSTNLRIEVPGANFAVFREPMRLRLTFGPTGWRDPNFRPEMRYWETYQEEWRIASHSCPSDQAFEQWDRERKVYSLAICHLTQFAVFQVYSPPVAPTPAPEPPRPESYEDPVFFIALAGAVVAIIVICCVWYMACIRKSKAARDRPLDFSEFGIRPVSVRFSGLKSSGHARVSPLPLADGPPSPGGRRRNRRQSEDEVRQLMPPPPEERQQEALLPLGGAGSEELPSAALQQQPMELQALGDGSEQLLPAALQRQPTEIQALAPGSAPPPPSMRPPPGPPPGPAVERRGSSTSVETLNLSEIGTPGTVPTAG